MSCSKESTVKYLITKNLIKPNMELFNNLPSERLISTIDRITKQAKSIYGVDMGSLFSIKFRDIAVGNYLVEGSSAIKTKARLEANDAAFEAIDRSKQQETQTRQAILNKARYDAIGTVAKEYEDIKTEGNFMLSEEGDVIVPNSLPQINIRC